MKTLICVVLIMAGAVTGEDDWRGAMVEIEGAGSLEELEQEVVDRYEAMARNPVRINFASAARLRSSGLMSNYQIASLRDYQERTGDVRSYAELALVDGFNQAFVDKIRHFVSVEYAAEPAGRKDMDWRGTMKVKADLKSGGMLVSASQGERLLVSIGAGRIDWQQSLGDIFSKRTDGKAKKIGGIKWNGSEITGSVRWNGKRWSITAGDFNARFGQGLTLWSGFTLSGASSERFDRNPGGISEGNGFTRGTRIRGAAAGWDSGRVSADALVGIDGSVGGNATWRWRTGQIGSTIYSADHGKSTVAGIDTKFNVVKVDFFSEAAFDFAGKCLAGLAGMSFSPEYGRRYSIIGRHYPTGFNSPLSGAFRSASRNSDETGVSAAARAGSLTATLDAAYHPSKSQHHFRAIVNWNPQFQTGAGIFKPALKFSERYRPNDPLKHRAELRIDAILATGAFENGLRADMIHSRSWSWMAHCESMYKTDKLTLCARATAFFVDSWDDRIYSYQRDVPGSFNVKALYGRGWMLSAYASYNKTLYLRVCHTGYPKTPEKNNFEIRLEYVQNFFHRRTPRSFHKNN